MKSVMYILLIMLITTTVVAKTNLNNFLIRYIQLSTPGGVAKANNYKLKNYTLIRNTSFMGTRTKMNKLVIPSLKCVEKRIKTMCSDDYKIKNISGWRDSDSIKGAELSDHIFGSAIDINTFTNSCCGCTKKWKESSLCKGEGVIENPNGPNTGRYDLPECWISAFKEENWYWYGDDPSLRDTMHFTFIGKPNQSCQ